jgi:TIR domain
MSVFVSYAREDRHLVDELVHDLKAVNQEVWIDTALTGGEAWWQTVLEQVRECAAFVFALSPASVKSLACLAELSYASDLSRSIVPVKVGRVDVEIAPPPIPNLEVIEYRTKDKDSALAVANAIIRAARRSAPLPDPLPESPAAPASYATSLKAEIDAKELSVKRQGEILEVLKGRLDDPDFVNRRLARGLLADLRARADVGAAVAMHIDQLLKKGTRPSRRRAVIGAGAGAAALVTIGALVFGLTRNSSHDDQGQAEDVVKAWADATTRRDFTEAARIDPTRSPDALETFYHGAEDPVRMFSIQPYFANGTHDGRRWTLSGAAIVWDYNPAPTIRTHVICSEWKVDLDNGTAAWTTGEEKFLEGRQIRSEQFAKVYDDTCT